MTSVFTGEFYPIFKENIIKNLTQNVNPTSLITKSVSHFKKKKTTQANIPMNVDTKSLYKMSGKIQQYLLNQHNSQAGIMQELQSQFKILKSQYNLPC